MRILLYLVILYSADIPGRLALFYREIGRNRSGEEWNGGLGEEEGGKTMV